MRVAELARMRSLKKGAVLLTIWSVLNFIVAAGVTVMTLAGKTPIVALVLGDSARQGLDARLVAIVSAQAAFCNPCIAVLCVLVTVLAWRGLMARARWAWWALAGTLLPLQVFGFVSDTFIGGHNLAANLAGTAMLAAGLGLAARGLFSSGGAVRA